MKLTRLPVLILVGLFLSGLGWSSAREAVIPKDYDVLHYGSVRAVSPAHVVRLDNNQGSGTGRCGRHAQPPTGERASPQVTRVGRIVPEFADKSLPEVLHGSYRLVYRVLPGEIEILAVYHGARLLSL